MESFPANPNLKQKLAIFIDWNLKTLGILFIITCLLTYYGHSTPFKTIELTQIDNNLTELNHAMSEVQDNLVDLYNKTKK